MNIKFYAGSNYPDNTIHSHVETENALKRGDCETLHTTCLAVFASSLLEKGHKLTLVYPKGREEPIAFGLSATFGRILRPQLDLLKLYLAREFGRKEDWDE